MNDQAAAPEAPAAPGHLGMRIVAGILLGMIPLVAFLLIMRTRSGPVSSLVEELPDSKVKQRLLAMGPRVVPRLVPHVYKAEHPDEKQLEIIDIIFKLGQQDQLPIFVRRAYFASAVEAPEAETRLFGLRGLVVMGPPFRLESIAVLLDDDREAVAHGSPGLIAAKRRSVPDRKGIVQMEAADFLVVVVGIDPRPPRKEPYTGAPDTTRFLSPEERSKRYRRLKEIVAKFRSGAPTPGDG